MAIFNAKNNTQPQALANILYTYIHKTAVDSTKTIFISHFRPRAGSG
jgi:hypothetical protein